MFFSLLRLTVKQWNWKHSNQTSIKEFRDKLLKHSVKLTDDGADAEISQEGLWWDGMDRNGSAWMEWMEWNGWTIQMEKMIEQWIEENKYLKAKHPPRRAKYAAQLLSEGRCAGRATAYKPLSTGTLIRRSDRDGRELASNLMPRKSGIIGSRQAACLFVMSLVTFFLANNSRCVLVIMWSSTVSTDPG